MLSGKYLLDTAEIILAKQGLMGCPAGQDKHLDRKGKRTNSPLIDLIRLKCTKEIKLYKSKSSCEIL